MLVALVVLMIIIDWLIVMGPDPREWKGKKK